MGGFFFFFFSGRRPLKKKEIAAPQTDVGPENKQTPLKNRDVWQLLRRARSAEIYKSDTRLQKNLDTPPLRTKSGPQPGFRPLYFLTSEIQHFLKVGDLECHHEGRGGTKKNRF